MTHSDTDWPRTRPAGAPTGDVEKVRLMPHGMISPALSSILSGGAEGTVTKGGGIQIDAVDGIQLKLRNSDALSPGTTVRVLGKRGKWAVPKRGYQAEQRVRDRQRRLRTILKERGRAWRQDHRRAEAEAFWSQYDLPVEVDIAIKGRLSGLTKGSWGDGRAANTVEHAYVREAFSEGRMEREADSYLCDPNATPQFNFDEENDRTDSDGESYTPPVTCNTCLKRMERWRVRDEDEVTVERVWDPVRPTPTFHPVSETPTTDAQPA